MGQRQWRLELEAHQRASASPLQTPAAHQQRAQEGLVPAARAHPRRCPPGIACGARAASAAPYRVRCLAARSSEQVRPQGSCTATRFGSEALFVPSCAHTAQHGATRRSRQCQKREWQDVWGGSPRTFPRWPKPSTASEPGGFALPPTLFVQLSLIHISEPTRPY